MSLRSIIKDFCKRHAQQMNTDAGQHFLAEDSVLQSIVAAAKIRPGALIVEIGAGLGILTKALLDAGARVLAIEWDRDWIPLLKEYTNADVQGERLTIINGNALKTSMPDEPYDVVANIPYHITAPLLRYLFIESKRQPTTATLLIQKEVAEKICGTDHPTFLSVLVGLNGKAAIVRHVPPDAFLPPPKVDSAVITITTHNPPLADTQTLETALELASVAFRGKRKMLRGTVGRIHRGLERLEAAAVSGERRPETLSIAEWIALARASHA